jgi:hypothetical protein
MCLAELSSQNAIPNNWTVVIPVVRMVQSTISSDHDALVPGPLLRINRLELHGLSHVFGCCDSISTITKNDPTIFAALHKFPN